FRRQRGFIAPMSPHTLAHKLGGESFRRVALVFGNEADGLDNDELRRCQATVHLPTFGDYPSYNLSMAVAVTLFTLRTTLDAQGLEDFEPRAPDAKATQAELDELNQAWLETLDVYGYFRRTQRDRFAPKLRAMLGRLELAPFDAGLLRGMIAHFRAMRDRLGSE
ncbi:MAG: TrmH family RNA methyltransferase, partial [Myxococcota bacterium]